MKRLLTVLIALLVAGAMTVLAQTPVGKWGSTAQGKAWPIKVTSATIAGNAQIGTGAAKPTGWATIRGGFDAPLTATTTQAVVVKGQFEMVGGSGGSGYTWLRYALTNLDSSTLNYVNTDSATWVSPKTHYGYEFDPISGAGTMANGSGGGTGAQGTAWLVNGGSWASTNSNGGGPFSDVKNAPRNAEAIAGTYDWAISVQSINDTTNEVRWYLKEVNNKYWFGGTVQTKSTTKIFNGVCFGFNSDNEAKQVNFKTVTAGLGTPITVPVAPWQAFYVDMWGSTAQGAAWPVKNDTTYLVGDATLGAGTAKPTGWATIRGGFGDAVPLIAGKALTVSGQMELVGGGGISAYTWLRYALTFQDSSTLSGRYTDTAKWVSTKGHSGYAFHPISGAGTMSNGNGGQGTVWSVNNGSWSSTYGNNGGPLTDVKNAPRNAEAIAGTYDWAISVQPINDTTNEVRWYLKEVNNKYWFGGTIQTKATTKKFNGVCFGFNSDGEAKQVKLIAVKVDYTSPLSVPVAPWQAFYVDMWGTTVQGKAWPVKNDTTYLVGDATLGTGAAKPTGWATIRGGFGDPVTIVNGGKAMTVTGQMEMIGGGGGSGYTWMRYALTFQDSSTLSGRYKDTANWVSTKGHYGYEFDPISGAGTMANGSGGGTGAQGTAWLVNNGSWASTNSNGGGPFSDVKNAPRNAEAIAGTYDWAISVQSINDTTNEVRWYLKEVNNKYWFGGTVQTKSTTKKFNGINFGFNSDNEAKQVKLIAVKVDMTSPITVPVAPWQAFYVDMWGTTVQGKAWPVKNDTTYLVGDATLGDGTAKPTGWATVRGGFGDPVAIVNGGKAMTVTGQMEMIGGGGGSGYTWMRYALTFQDSSTLSGRYKDTANWVSTKGHYGYEFDPISGSGTMANGSGGGTGAQGTAWLVNNGSWASTNSNGGGPFSDVLNAPRGAEAIAGTYDWAISVQSINDTTNEVRWYLKEVNNKYWFGGTVQTKSTTKKFNGVCFGFNSDNEAKQVKLLAVKVDMTAPITVPTAPWQDFYVGDFGFIGGKIGGWKYAAGDFVGNANFSGTATNTSPVAVRAGFGGNVEPKVGAALNALKITGSVTFVGGGFATPGSFRFGLFQSDSAGTLTKTPVDSTRWSGKETGQYGYLFVPPTGTSGATAWNNSTTGTWGGVVNGLWSSTTNANNYVIGSGLQTPANAVAGAGTYTFTILVVPQANGSNYVSYNLSNGTSYVWAGEKKYDTHAPVAAAKFNAMEFSLANGNTTTAMNIADLKVSMVAAPVGTGVETSALLVPKEYALEQNYPNPFNPSTKIAYDVPKQARVSITVFDLLGRSVATLVSGDHAPGRYSTVWNAASAVSGVYFYRIDATNADGSTGFTAVKKLMLLK